MENFFLFGDALKCIILGIASMKQKKERQELPVVVVVVLGDLGRSPRMGYHVTSLRKEGFRVVFVGYKGSNLDPNILQDEGVKISYVREFQSFSKGEIWRSQRVLFANLGVFTEIF